MGGLRAPCSELLSMILRFLCKAMFCSCAGEPAGEGTEPRGTLSQETLHCRVKKNPCFCLKRKYAIAAFCMSLSAYKLRGTSVSPDYSLSSSVHSLCHLYISEQSQIVCLFRPLVQRCA